MKKVKAIKDNVFGSCPASNVRYLTRCPVCFTRVKGTPAKFSLSSELNHVEFGCPSCYAKAIVSFDKLERVEISVEL